MRACSFTLVVSNSLRPCRLQPFRLLCPRDSPGKNIVGVVISFSGGSCRPRDQSHVSCIAGRFFIAEPSGKPSVWNTLWLFIRYTAILIRYIICIFRERPHSLIQHRHVKGTGWPAPFQAGRCREKTTLEAALGGSPLALARREKAPTRKRAGGPVKSGKHVDKWLQFNPTFPPLLTSQAFFLLWERELEYVTSLFSGKCSYNHQL